MTFVWNEVGMQETAKSVISLQVILLNKNLLKRLLKEIGDISCEYSLAGKLLHTTWLLSVDIKTDHCQKSFTFVHNAGTLVMYSVQLQNVSMLADEIEEQQKLRSQMLTPNKRLRRSPGTALRSPSSASSSPCMVGKLQCKCLCLTDLPNLIAYCILHSDWFLVNNFITSCWVWFAETPTRGWWCCRRD